MKRIISSLITLAMILGAILVPSLSAPAWNGDANGDGAINLNDVSLIMRHLAAWDVEIDPLADFDASGKVNLVDASLVMKHIAKWNVAPDSLLEAEYGVTEVDFTIPEPTPTEVVKGSEFGFDTAAADNSAAWIAAIAYLREHPGTTLEIEQGVYKMAPTATISLSGLKNCVIDGGGSTFLYSSGSYFNVSGDTDLFMIKNFTVDWNREAAGYPTSSVIRVKDIRETDDPKENEVDYEFFLEEDASFAMDIPWNSMIHMDPDTLTMGIVNGHGTVHSLKGRYRDLRQIAPNVITVTTDVETSVGDVWLLKHQYYSNPVFSHSSGTNVTYKDITIYSGPGGAIYLSGQNAHHARIDGVTVGLNPENADVTRMSVTADALNFKNTGGYIIVENCDIGFHGDDCINVHSTPGMVRYAYDDTLEVALRNGVNFYAGCEIGFKDASTFDEDEFTATVEQIIHIKDDRYYLVLDEYLPEDITDADEYSWMVYNKSNNSENIIIRNNYFHEAHSHGVVMRCSNALIENNHFYKLWWGAINVSIDYGYLWIEGTGLHNVIIRNNIFEKNDLQEGNGELAFFCNIDLSEFKGILGAPFRDVLISGNTFKNPRGNTIVVRNVVNASVVNNRIENPDPLKLYSGEQEHFTGRGRITFGNAVITNATIIHNTWEKSPYIPENINEIGSASFVDSEEMTLYGNIIVDTAE